MPFAKATTYKGAFDSHRLSVLYFSDTPNLYDGINYPYRMRNVPRSHEQSLTQALALVSKDYPDANIVAKCHLDEIIFTIR